MANGDAPVSEAAHAIAVPGDAVPAVTSRGGFQRRPRRQVAVAVDPALEGYMPAQCPSAPGPRARSAVATVADLQVIPAPDLPRVMPVRPELSVAEPAVEEQIAEKPAADTPQYAAPEGAVVAILDVMSRAQGGDPLAFGELYDHYVDLVYRYIYYRVGSAATAEDLTSETFLRALRRISSFTWQGRDPGAWFVTIARNLVADHYKSGRYRFEVTTADMLDAGADRSEDSPEGEVLDAITHATLLEAVTRLNPEQQECIVLRFLQGFSVAETARAMSKNEGAIKALQYRAVRTLGRLLPQGLSGP
jgi:RNA polymerase sigma-70 factor, ECF subfamily